MKESFLRSCVASLVLISMPAASQPVYELLAEGKAALQAGDASEAVRLLETAVSLDDELAEAHHLLARAFLRPEIRDIGRAKSSSARALRLDPDNVEYLSLQLYRQYHFSSSLLPALRTAQNEGLARRLLDLDPDHALGHRVLGEIALADYLDFRGSVSFPDLDALDLPASSESQFNAAYLLDPVLQPHEGSNKMAFAPARRGTSHRIGYVNKDRESEKRRSRAREHLWLAQAADPYDFDTYRSLMRIVMLDWDQAEADRLGAEMVASAGEHSDAWLFKGVADYRAGRLATSQASFERSVYLMDREEAAVYQDASLVIGELRLNSADPDRWKGKDPVLLTVENERKLEHFARLAYADLRFARPAEGLRGWETEPGEVVVRYGLPEVEVQNTTRFDRYLVLHYGSFYFKFMDLAKSGKLTFYSPKAGNAAPDFDSIDRAYDNDFSLISKSIFRHKPEQFVYDANGRRVAFPVLASAFLSENGPEAVVVLGVPGDVSTPVTSGVFVLDERGGILGESVSETVLATAERAGEFTVIHHTVALPSNLRSLAMAVEFDNPGGGAVGFQRMPVSPVESPADKLVLSDLLLAYLVEEAGDRMEGVGLQRRGHAVVPAPWGVFEAGQNVYIYFEAYGIEQSHAGGSRIEVEAVLREFDGEDPTSAIRDVFLRGYQHAVSVRYQGLAAAMVDARYVILDTSGLRPGTYIVGLRLTEIGTGKTAQSGRVIVLN